MSQIEIDEVLGLVGNVATEISSNNTMPCGIVFFVEFLLDVCSNVFFNVVFLKGCGCTIHGILLHVL